MNKQKAITFYEESYWTGCGGDCCPDWETIIYSSDKPIGSQSCPVDCYISAMEYFGYPICEMTDDTCWEYSEDELESIAREWGICVDFVS